MSIETSDNKDPQIIIDAWDAILNDRWINGVTWGQPRTGKTTADMVISYNIYKDWDAVLGSFVFMLAGLMFNMKNGLPCRIMTRNGLHNRVPLLIGDDWGANMNKAKTQHEKAIDLVKGAWDTYGTRLAVFLANMNQPDEITLQLCNKYNAEIYVSSPGFAKYDKIDWEQNFKGWQPRQGKDWVQSFRFPQAPMDVYKEYDELRKALCDEMDLLIEAAISETELAKVIKRATKKDIELLETINLKGRVTRDFFNKEENLGLKEPLKKAKAFGLVTPIRIGTYYHYEVTNFGLEVLDVIAKGNTDPTELKRQMLRTEHTIKQAAPIS